MIRLMNLSKNVKYPSIDSIYKPPRKISTWNLKSREKIIPTKVKNIIFIDIF